MIVSGRSWGRCARDGEREGWEKQIGKWEADSVHLWRITSQHAESFVGACDTQWHLEIIPWLQSRDQDWSREKGIRSSVRCSTTSTEGRHERAKRSADAPWKTNPNHLLQVSEGLSPGVGAKKDVGWWRDSLCSWQPQRSDPGAWGQSYRRTALNSQWYQSKGRGLTGPWPHQGERLTSNHVRRGVDWTTSKMPFYSESQWVCG